MGKTTRGSASYAFSVCNAGHGSAKFGGSLMLSNAGEIGASYA